MNIIRAFNDSFTFVSWKWNNIRSFKSKVAIMVAGLLIMSFIYTLANMSFFLGMVTSSPQTLQDETMRTIVSDYLRNTLYNEHTTVSGVLWGILASTILIPLVGYSFPTLIPINDAAIVRKNSNYRISDSIVLQYISSIAIIQLAVMTLLGSVLGIGTSQPGLSILAAWAIWINLIVLNVFMGWSVEFVQRKFGLKGKVIFGLAILSLLAAAAIFIENAAITFFGLNVLVFDFIRGASPINLIFSAAVSLSINAIITAAIFKLGRKTLSIPERAKKIKKKVAAFTYKKANNRTISQILLSMILRLPNIWRPILMSTFFGLATIFILQGDNQVFISLIIIVPLIVSMSWGSNVFGIIGGGLSWLVSQPKGKNKLFVALYTAQVGMILALSIGLAILMNLLYGTAFSDIRNYLMGVTAAGLIMSGSALKKSILSPEKYRVDLRGENILSPAKALNYLFRYLAFGGALGFAVYSIPDETYKVAAFAIIILLHVGQMSKLNRLWSKEDTVSRIISVTGY